MATPNEKKVDFDGESFNVDAALIAESLGITPTLVQTLMREGRITSRCERGVDQDAGRHRLTFFHGERRLRLVVNEAGDIVERCVDSARPHTSRLRRRLPGP